jgi:predicted DsbA family dithiol-disulfide isomerase
VAEDDPSLGPSDALVTLVGLFDLVSPFCAQVNGTLKQLRERYPTDLRIVWKDSPQPSHPLAERAAILGRLIFERRGNAAFWSYVDRVFDTRPTELKNGLRLLAIHEWSDLQCPYCSRVQPTIAAVQKAFPTQVKVVWHHMPLPFHANAQIAAEVGEEVLSQKGNAAFWAFQNMAFEAQSQPDGLKEQNLIEMASKLGVNVPRLRLALDARTHAARVEKDASLAKERGIAGIPTLIVGDFLVSGPQSEAVFRRLVERSLEEVKRKQSRR